MEKLASWRLAEGDAIVAGRHAIERIGGGRRYEAYLAWDDDLHALAVAKLVRPDQVGEEAALAILRSEAEALERLDHPHLVRAFDAELSGERPHLLLELVEGPRLSTLSRRYGIVAEQLLPLALCVCSALHYMHRSGFVHLDVKPRNIIMAGTPRLIDLSLARTAVAAAEISTPTGTDSYMAPEQCDPARHRRQIGPPADIWGIGVTLYEALAGRLPWDGTAHRFPQLDSDPLPLTRDDAELPPGVAPVIESCLERRPGDRPAAADVAAAIEPVVDGLPAPRIGRFKPGASWRRDPDPAAAG